MEDKVKKILVDFVETNKKSGDSTFYSTVYKIRNRASRWNHSAPPGSKERKVIKKEIKEILSNMSSIRKLAGSYEFCSQSDVLRNLVEKRMEDVLEQILPHINDFRELAYYHEEVPSDSRASKLVEKRMKELLQNVSKDNVPKDFIFILEENEVPKGLVSSFKNKALEIIKVVK